MTAPPSPEPPPPLNPSSRVPDEDQLLSDTPSRQRHLWLDLLTPLAIIVAGASIAGALWLSRSSDGSPPEREVAADATLDSPLVSSVTPSPSPSAGRPRSLLQTFLDYGREAGLDSATFRTCLFDSASAELVTDHLRRGAEFGVSGTPTFFINNKKIVGAQPLAVFQEIIDRELNDAPQSADAYSEAIQTLAATSPPRFEVVDAVPDTSDATFDGNRSAQVIIAEFSDFQCPFCRRWTQQTLVSLRSQFGPDVALAFLHFPIVQIHPNAGNASVAAFCAGLQGKFWEMHDILFLRQQEWASLTN